MASHIPAEPSPPQLIVKPPNGRVRRSTATARFGSSKREGHDASAFYERFVRPEVSEDAAIVPPAEVDAIYPLDARDMSCVRSGSVALVVTSPPYFAGKEYEEVLGQNGAPASYFEYLGLLRGVFEECRRVLEPGGRIAVNVANLGRKPYRSLSGDVAGILQDLGLLLRGEVVWWKGRAAGGSCAWGTFQRPGNPVLRDVTERVVIASKGRFDRALAPEERLARGLPSTATISREEFMESTTDLWELPPESATRVGHPAPFPVELPLRLIELFTYKEDLVLDPFMGSGTTAVAAVRSGRHYIGFETEESYIRTAAGRIAGERQAAGEAPPGPYRLGVEIPAASSGNAGLEGTDDPKALAVREGKAAKDVARILLEGCGFSAIKPGVKVPGRGIDLAFTAKDRLGNDWAFDVCGAFTTSRAGLRRIDTLWRALGTAAVFHSHCGGRIPLVLLTTDAPSKGSAGHMALNAVLGQGQPVYDVIELLDKAGQERLAGYSAGGPGS